MARQRSTVEPRGWAPPKGYANGVVAEGRMLFVAGQVGWDPANPTPTFEPDFAGQFDRALANVVAVVREAGGQPEDLVRLTLYVTDKREYVACVKQVGESWKRHVGRSYPAMTLVQVAGLLQDEAKLELEATALL
ncbi:RidA family protein [Myxococcaceae bacterium GXIMD 01537]